MSVSRRFALYVSLCGEAICAVCTALCGDGLICLCRSMGRTVCCLYCGIGRRYAPYCSTVRRFAMSVSLCWETVYAVCIAVRFDGLRCLYCYVGRRFSLSLSLHREVWGVCIDVEGDGLCRLYRCRGRWFVPSVSM